MPRDQRERVVRPLHAALELAIQARASAGTRLLADHRLRQPLVAHALLEPCHTFARLRELQLRAHVLEVVARRPVGLGGAREALVGTRVRPGEPVAVGHPQLAPLVWGLDVVVHGETVNEVLLGFVVLPQRGGRQRNRAIGRGLLVAVAQLEAQLERRLRLLVRVLRTVQEQVALRATPPQLDDHVAARNQCESVREHFVIALERGFGVALLELDVAQVLETEELGAGFGNLIGQPRALVNALDRLSDPAFGVVTRNEDGNQH